MVARSNAIQTVSFAFGPNRGSIKLLRFLLNGVTGEGIRRSLCAQRCDGALPAICYGDYRFVLQSPSDRCATRRDNPVRNGCHEAQAQISHISDGLNPLTHTQRVPKLNLLRHWLGSSVSALWLYINGLRRKPKPGLRPFLPYPNYLLGSPTRQNRSPARSAPKMRQHVAAATPINEPSIRR